MAVIPLGLCGVGVMRSLRNSAKRLSFPQQVRNEFGYRGPQAARVVGAHDPGAIELTVIPRLRPWVIRCRRPRACVATTACTERRRAVS